MICPVCAFPQSRPMPFYYEFQDKTFEAFQCASCRLSFLWPQPDDATITAMYAKDYFESDFRCGHCSSSAFDVEGGMTLPSWADGLSLARDAKVLEIGCATGYTLSAFQKAGYTTLGVEISEEASAFARDKFHLNVVTGMVNSVVLPESQFDLIYMLDVFEHLADPAGTLKRIHGWLKPGGTAVFVIPTQTNTLYSRLGLMVYGLLGKRTRINMPPYHLVEYRPRTFRNLLRRHGFEVIKMRADIISPSQIGLRGNRLQNLAKRAFQYPNYFLTKLSGFCGDRLTAIVRK